MSQLPSAVQCTGNRYRGIRALITNIRFRIPILVIFFYIGFQLKKRYLKPLLFIHEFNYRNNNYLTEKTTCTPICFQLFIRHSMISLEVADCRLVLVVIDVYYTDKKRRNIL